MMSYRIPIICKFCEALIGHELGECWAPYGIGVCDECYGNMEKTEYDQMEAEQDGT
jgi:hypothetical protein